jgi:hypothetical protein
MNTIKVTLPTNKPGQLAVFTIKFNLSNFDEVIEKVSTIKTYEELKSNTLWAVI